MEALIGTALGSFTRLIPEILKWFDRKDERKHEVAMFGLHLEADRQRGEIQLQQDRIAADASIGAAEIEALIEATKAQARPSGIRWVDAINSLMRPLITFWWVIFLYTAALVAQFVYLINLEYTMIEAVLKLWGPDERAISSSIISFWFVDRSLRKGGGVSR